MNTEATTTYYTCGSHLSETDQCRICGEQFCQPVADPQAWLDAQVAAVAADARQAVAAQIPGETLEDTFERWGVPTDDDAIPVGVHVGDSIAEVTGWWGFADEDGAMTEWTSGPITIPIPLDVTARKIR